MKRFFCVFILALFCSFPSWAELRVVKLGPAMQLSLEGIDPVRVGDRIPIFSKSSAQVLGVLRIEQIESDSVGRTQAKARVISMTGLGFIQVGDLVHKTDWSGDGTPPFAGRLDLLAREEHKQVAARYKPLIALGLDGETAATLEKGERMTDLVSNFMYALNDRFSVNTLLLVDPWLPNLGLKYKLFENDYLSYSARLAGLWSYETQSWATQFIQYISIPSGPKFISHLSITLSTNNLNSSGVSNSILTSSISGSTEYIFDDWDRLIFGPSYNFNFKTVGGFVNYMFIWQHLHLLLGLESSNLSRFKLSLTNGYFPRFYMYWRY